VLRRRFGLDVAQAMVDETVTLAEMRKLAQWSFLQEERVGDDWWFEFLPLIQRYLQQSARKQGELAIGHERAITYFWNRRRPWTGAFEDCRAELETFYHLCELKQYAEANRVMDTCVEILNRQGYYARLTPIYEQLTQEWQPSNEEEVRNVGAAWTRLGNLYQSLGQYEAAIASHEKTQALSLEISNRRGEAISLGNLGIAYHSLGKYQCAIELYQQHGNIAREIGDRRGEAASLGNLGNAYHSLGQYQCAIKLYQQSLDIACAISDRGGEANSLGNLGGAYDSLGQYQRALNFHQQSLNIARAISDRGGEAISLFNLGNTLAKLNRSLEARQHLEQAKQIFKALELDFEVEKCDAALQRLSKIRIPFWVYFLVGLAIVLLIWWLKH